MKILLDENLPKRLKLDFDSHDVCTVYEKKWNGIKNGKLLHLMQTEEFDVLLTFDKNLQYQQNFEKYTIAVFVLSAKTNTYEVFTQLSSQVIILLNHRHLPKGVTIVK